MNDSGRSVKAAAQFFKVEPDAILVVHDEGDLEAGRLQARRGGGLAGHNGLRSIAQHLGTDDFLRLRVGVGRPGRGDRRPLADYVLADFEPHEDREGIVARAADAVETLDAEGLEAQPRTASTDPSFVKRPPDRATPCPARPGSADRAAAERLPSASGTVCEEASPGAWPLSTVNCRLPNDIPVRDSAAGPTPKEPCDDRDDSDSPCSCSCSPTRSRSAPVTRVLSRAKRDHGRTCARSAPHRRARRRLSRARRSRPRSSAGRRARRQLRAAAARRARTAGAATRRARASTARGSSASSTSASASLCRTARTPTSTSAAVSPAPL